METRIYNDNHEHLSDELAKLDLLILRRVTAMRKQISEMQEITADPKLFISHEEVDRLLGQEERSQERDRNGDGHA